MSACVVLQTGNCIFMGSDSAISTTIQNQIFRLNESGVKLWRVGEMSIFCSGNMRVAYQIMAHYLQQPIQNLKTLQSIVRHAYSNEPLNEIEIMVGEVRSNASYVYSMSKDNNYDIEIHEMSKDADSVAIWTAGIKTAESSIKAIDCVKQGVAVSEIYKQVFDDISYEGIGGQLIVHQITKDENRVFLHYLIKEKADMKLFSPGQIQILFDSYHLIVGERVFGKLLAGSNLTIDASNEVGQRLFKVDGNGVTIAGGSLTVTGGLPASQLDPAILAGVDADIAAVQASVTQLETDVDTMMSDSMITAVEANTLKVSLAEVTSESIDLINVAMALSITTEKTNYSNALTTLTTELNKWIDKTGYPLSITATDRINIKTKFSTLQSTKSVLINKISAVREQRAKDASVGLGTAYNGVTIDAANGVVVLKSDVTIRAILNATKGLAFQRNTGTQASPNWVDMLAYDTQTGNLSVDGIINARDLKVNGASVLTGDGKFKSSSIDTLYIGRNVFMAPEATISYTQISDKPYIPTVPGYITSTKITSTSIESPNVTGGTITGGSIVGGTITGATIQTSSDTTVRRVQLTGAGLVSLNGNTEMDLCWIHQLDR